MQLIERLKEKQMRQRKAYQQLEAVLALGSSGWVRGGRLLQHPGCAVGGLGTSAGLGHPRCTLCTHAAALATLKS